MPVSPVRRPSLAPWARRGRGQADRVRCVPLVRSERVARSFNTSGVCDPDRHFMVPAAGRLPAAHALVEQGAWFVVHAPRQSGKTTTLRAIAADLTAGGRFTALHFSCEAARAFPDNPAAAHSTILDEIRIRAGIALPAELRPPVESVGPGASELRGFLARWCARSIRPVVLFFDEIDALTGPTLFSVLSQLRAAHGDRPGAAPWSVALCGLRDVRDYKAAAGGAADRLGSASPFNIKVESLRLGDFSEADVAALYGLDTFESGRRWSDGAIKRASVLTEGQPWLVNALAREIVEKLQVVGEVDESDVDRARERLIQTRATHLDSLVARLDEVRVRSALIPVLGGDALDLDDEDVAYAQDLGLLAVGPPLRVANPIYREIILRVLASRSERTALVSAGRYVRADGSLDIDGLMDGFAAFWREQKDAISPSMPWRELAAQLVLMGFLHALVNDTGIVERETGFGRGRIDILVRWPLPGGGWQRAAMELKVWREGRADPLREGVDQIDTYLGTLGLDEGTLVVFDQRTATGSTGRTTTWETATTATGRAVRVLRA